MNYLDYKYYFFIGAGGIGMSSLAKYLAINNKNIAGYDREKTELTCNLEKIGIDILYDFEETIYIPNHVHIWKYKKLSVNKRLTLE